MPAPIRRDLHPLAWWGWAVCVAAAASTVTNPLVVGLLVAAVVLVVLTRRGGSPWARAFRLYLWLGAIVVVSRMVLHVLVGLKYGDHVLVRLPAVPMPDWAAGIQLGGTVRLEGLLAAASLGLRLAAIIVAIGAANALANPKRLLKSLPRALHEVGTAVVVSVSVAPQLAESVQRVMRARALRGSAGRGIRALPRVALPVLQDTLDRSLMLASAMESRGYGSHRGHPRPRWLPVLTTIGLLLLAVGMYGVLDPENTPVWSGFPVLLTGVVLSMAGIWLTGRAVRISAYRPPPWRTAETVTLLCGVAAFAAMLLAGHRDPAMMSLSTQPLTAPQLPVWALVSVLAVGLPAVITPPPALSPDRSAKGTR